MNTEPWFDALRDVTWLESEEGITLVVGGPAGNHVRVATDLEREMRDQLQRAADSQKEPM